MKDREIALFNELSDWNMAHFFRYELMLIMRGGGISLSNGTRRTLRRCGLIKVKAGNLRKRTKYVLTDKGKRMLEEVKR
jgi:hypothetical protein